jgi:DNA-binding response OmpR family regulator
MAGKEDGRKEDGMRSHRKRTVLLVDDELLILMDLQDAVEAAGHVAEIASGVESALSIIRRREVDLAILDVSVASGLDCLPIARALADQSTPFILFTGSADMLPQGVADLDVEIVAKPTAAPEVVRTALSLLA